MFFYVFMDPKIITDAKDKGDFALKHLHGILKGFTINCAFLTFEDYHQIEEIGNIIKEIPSSFLVKEIKTILGHFDKNKRFIFNLIPDYNGKKSDIECLYEQHDNKELDILLLKICDNNSFEWTVETANIDNYNESIFEKKRFEYTRNGKAFRDDEYSEHELLNIYLKKLFVYAHRIEICDYSFGKNFRDDYIYSWKVFINWFNSIRNNTHSVEIIFHCDKDDDNRAKFMITKLKENLPHPLNNIEVYLNFYKPTSSSIALPHEHYIYTEQFSINFGRGMDMFKEETHKNRNTTFSYMNVSEIQKKVESCNHLLEQPARIKIC